MKNYKNIFYVGTVYSLLISIIMKPNLDENLYFFNEDFSKEIVNKFKNKIVLRKYKESIKLFRYYKVRNHLYKILNENREKIKNKEFFIQDHLTYSQFFLNNFENNFSLIEDGVGNYITKILLGAKEEVRKPYLYKYMNIIKKYYPTLGLSKKIKKIYLTGILPIPKLIENKVEIVNIRDTWEKLSELEQKKILDIFNIKLEKLKELNKLEDKILLITQPLSEDRVITEQEKIEIYQEILEQEKNKTIYIKPHPREKTDYLKVFSKYDIRILEKDFPLELLSFLEIKFSKAITLFSTAVFSFKEKYEIEFIGTEKYEKLYERFGKIEIY